MDNETGLELEGSRFPINSTDIDCDKYASKWKILTMLQNLMCIKLKSKVNKCEIISHILGEDVGSLEKL